MNPRALILILLAGVGVILVFFLTRAFLSNNAPQQVQPTQQVVERPAASILVAAADLPIGTIISPDHMLQQEWPESALNEAYYRADENSNTTGELVGMVVRSPLQSGAPVTRSSLVAQGERGFMAAILSPGMRAVTIALTPESSIGGFVYPGDRVDVILTHRVQRESGNHNLSETVLSNVRVLGVDQSSEKDATGVQVRKTATLEVTPKMAEKVAVMKRIGAMSLSLRSLARASGDLASDPNSPPVARTTSTTQDSEVSKYLPKLGQNGNENAILVDRGAVRTVVKTGGLNISATAPSEDANTALIDEAGVE